MSGLKGKTMSDRSQTDRPGLSGTPSPASGGIAYPPVPDRLIGHRGAAASAPENTLASFQAASAAGARWVEFDVKLTAEGVPIVLHDDTLDRTTNGQGPVAALCLADLKDLDAGSWFSTDFAGERVPTLAETLDTLAVLGLGANIELKPCPGRTAETARAALAVAQRRWPQAAPPLVISSFDLDALAEAAAIAAQGVMTPWPRALLADAADGWTAALLVERARALGCVGVHLDDALASAETLETLRAAGLRRAVWTVNDRSRALALWEQGADAIITDRPASLLDKGDKKAGDDPVGPTRR